MYNLYPASLLSAQDQRGRTFETTLNTSVLKLLRFRNDCFAAGCSVRRVVVVMMVVVVHLMRGHDGVSRPRGGSRGTGRRRLVRRAL